eukprot:1501115-Prymnesium_polylepis.1
MKTPSALSASSPWVDPPGARGRPGAEVEHPCGLRLFSAAHAARALSLPPQAMEDIDVERRISLEDLQSMANAAELESVLWTSPDNVTPNPVGADNAWVCFEAEVRRANASALSKIRHHGGERCGELLRLLDIEEQTRCQ